MPEWPEGIITMHDMEAIYEITDLFGIDRETIQVELTKEDPGVIGRNARGVLEITVPASIAVEDFATSLKAALETMGHKPSESDE